jgi:hypothetical protein
MPHIFVGPKNGAGSAIDMGRVNASLAQFDAFTRHGIANNFFKAITNDSANDDRVAQAVTSLAAEMFLCHHISNVTRKASTSLSFDEDEASFDDTFGKLAKDDLSEFGAAADVINTYAYMFPNIMKQRTARTPMLDTAIVSQISLPGGIGQDEFYSMRQFGAGQAQLYTGGTIADNMGSYLLDKFVQKVVTVVYSASTSIFTESRAAIRGIADLNEQITLGKQAIDRKMNSLILNGDDDSLLYGFLNHPMITQVYANRAWDSTVVDNMDIITDMMLNMFGNYSDAADVESNPNRLLLPVPTNRFLTLNVADDDSKESTIMGKLRRFIAQARGDKGDNSDFSITTVQGLANAFGSGNHACIWMRPEAVSAVIPTASMMLPIERHGVTIQAVQIARTGGIKVEDDVEVSIGRFSGDY